MKIVQLVAENIKKLTAIDITPTDNMVLVTGPNGAGKSSILDCIVMALCGGKAIPQVPVKRGADKGKIIIDMGEYTVTRSFTKENSYLKIENKDGSNVSSPQKFLDKIVGNISFDPLDFLNNETKKQRDILLTLLGINVNEIDQREKKLREDRTLVGRERDRLKPLYESITSYPEVSGAKEVSAYDLSTKLQDALKQNSSHAEAVTANEQIKALAMKDKERIDAIELEIQKLTKEKEELAASILQRKEVYVATKNRLAETVLINTDSIQQEIAQVESTNQKIRANINKDTAKRNYDIAVVNYEAFTKQIESIATERANLLSSAAMPVDGLSFDDGGLLYKGIPLDQASDGEKLMVSLGISMALNPTLKVLRIKDGSLLDEHNRAIILDMIKDRDYQLWFESVGSDGKVGILIEEGEIISVDGQPAKGRGKKKAEEPKPEPIPAPAVPQPDNTQPTDGDGW